jgi:polar amino acid transport system ATP-binding protein
MLSGCGSIAMVCERTLSVAMQPAPLLCDEIASALDSELVNEVLGVLGEFAAKGMTLLMIALETRFAREVCDRVVLLHQGRAHEIGAPEGVFTRPRTPELQQCLATVQ